MGQKYFLTHDKTCPIINAMYAIDKHIPIPESARNGRPAKYPFKNMNVGDSFFVAGEHTGRLLISIRGCALRNKPKVFYCEQKKTAPTGVRCWRVE
jgi:hypothetical protein